MSETSPNKLSPNDSSSLHGASVQDIQLELIRRTSFNLLDGNRVYESLLKHRDLWQAVILDRMGLPNHKDPTHLPAMALIKLRDLPGDQWNADTLFILTKSLEKSHELARVIAEDHWSGEVEIHENQEEIQRSLGVGGEEYGLVTVWWD